MDRADVSLFGTFQIRRAGEALAGFDACKVQELFCYLLLNRDRRLARESVASILWGECTTTQSRAYLRKALWQLQAAIVGSIDPSGAAMLQTESDWIQLATGPFLRIDVALFETAFSRTHGVAGEDLDDDAAGALREAAELYRDDLLGSWYHDWCDRERERLRGMLMQMLEKLMAHAASRGEYEIGIEYGERILRCDCAHERAHRELMRLRDLAGDRTGALRQYERCRSALREELGVEPAARTAALYDQIRSGSSHQESTPARTAQSREESAARPSLGEVLGRLRELQSTLHELEHLVAHEIRGVESALEGERVSERAAELRAERRTERRTERLADGAEARVIRLHETERFGNATGTAGATPAAVYLLRYRSGTRPTDQESRV